MKRGAYVVLLAFLLPALSGCIGAKTTVVTTTVDRVSQSFKPGEFPEGYGGLRGITINENGAYISGVHLTILETVHYVRSDEKGRFDFGAVPVGTYILRADHVDYRFLERQIEVRANEVAEAEVVLLAPGGSGGDFLQHQHDLWQGKTEDTIFNGKTSVPKGPITSGETSRSGYLCTGVVTTNAEGCFVAPVRLPDGKMVYPGTKELRVKITWEPRDLVTKVELQYTPADQTYPRVINEIQHGDTVTIEVAPASADHGHQVRSQWWFGVVMRPKVAGQPTSGLGTEPTNELFSPEATVTIVAVKGEQLPSEPPHPRYWENGNRILLMKHGNGINVTATRDPTAPNGAVTCASYAQSCRLISKRPEHNTTIVPPGTTRLSIVFEWGVGNDALALNAKERTLLVRKGNVNPAEATWESYVEPTVVKTEGRKITYELKLKPEETDPYYQKKSNFVFSFAKVGEESERSYRADCPYNCGGDTFTLTVEAVNDYWTEALAKPLEDEE